MTTRAVVIVPTKSNHFECVSGQNVVEMEHYILYAQSGKGEPMEWIVEAETLSDFIDHGRYTLSTKPLIRCKDCKYSSDEYCHCSKVTWWNSKDDFCSKGERRTDEQTD